MMPDDVRLSKRLSPWLRHQPEAGGLTLDAQGWTDVDAVLAGLVGADMPIDWSTQLRLVEESDKQRVELSADASRIRARQGHSVAVQAGAPAEAGYVFFLTGNGVWLTDHVPSSHLAKIGS